MPLYKIQRHIARAGRLIGCRGDSYLQVDKHLTVFMISFFVTSMSTTTTHISIANSRFNGSLPVPVQAMIRHQVLLGIVLEDSISRL